MKLSSQKPILILGIGIFFYLATASMAYLFKESLRILLLNRGGFPPLVIKLVIESVYVMTYIIGIFALLRVLKSTFIRFDKLFFILILLLALGQILQFVITQFTFDLYTEEYFANVSDYYDFFKINYWYHALDAGFEYFMYIILGLIIYKNQDLILKSESQVSDISEIGRNS